jgi:TIR domain-containing protein
VNAAIEARFPTMPPMAMASGIWKPALLPGTRFFRLFVSHTHQHRQEVGLLSAALSAHGVAAFVAHDAIQPTNEWQDVIVQGLRECEALSAYLTDDFHASDWTDQEVGAAVERGLLVFPLRVDVNPYGFIARYQAMDARAGKDPHVLAREIAEVLRADPRTRSAMAEVAVDRFVHSYSYASARMNFEHLQGIAPDLWTPEMADAVQRAVGSNDQISQAHVGYEPNVRSVGDEALKLVAAAIASSSG